MVRDAQDRVQENVHLKKVLTISGYPKWSWILATNNNKATSMNIPVKGSVSIPYVQGITDELSRYTRAQGVMVHP